MPGLRLGIGRLPIALGAAALSGLLLWAALPPLDLGPLGFVALVPLLWAVRGARARRGALLGLVQGLVSNGLILGWLFPISILGASVLVAGLAAWVALFGGIAAATSQHDRPFRGALIVAAAWAATEWLRLVWPFGGWGWVGLGYTQAGNALVRPLAGVAGALGTAFLVAGINALVFLALLRLGRSEGRRAALTPLLAAVVLAVAPAAIPLPTTSGPPVDVAVVQGNVPLGVATQSRIIRNRTVADNHAALHVRLADDPPDLAVWAENALDDDPTRVPDLRATVETAVRLGGAPTLIGAITTTGDGRLLNEDLLYDRDARIVGRYAKVHLLPFGEFVPFRRWLNWIPDVSLVREDLSPGSGVGEFRIPSGSFAAAICFENAFPDLVRRFTTADDGFIVISTNDSTFGVSPASDQHVLLSRLRALENGRWLVHASLSGSSAFIDPRGAVVSKTGLFEQAILRGEVLRGSGRTVFNVIGGWLPVVYLVITAGAVLAPRRRRRGRVEPLPEEARATVVLPTYEERDSIEEVIRRLLTADERVEVLVVDDSSPDGTGELVRKIAERDERVSLVERPEKGGLASAYLEGFGRSIAARRDIVVEMDADLSHRPEELPRLLRGARDHHLVIGTRYMRGGEVRNWSFFRRLVSRAGNLYARVVLGLPARDATSGFRAYRRQVLEDLLGSGISSEGYAFQVELAYRAWRRGWSVGEVPITFEERRAGQSKFSQGIIAEALWRILVWGLRDRILRRDP